MYKVNTIEIKDVQNTNVHERRSIRVNIRLTQSQNKFIMSNNLSITKVMNEALKQLGYVSPKLEEIPPQDVERGDDGEYWKSHRGRGDRVEQRKRWKARSRFKGRRH